MFFRAERDAGSGRGWREEPSVGGNGHDDRCRPLCGARGVHRGVRLSPPHHPPEGQGQAARSQSGAACQR